MDLAYGAVGLPAPPVKIWLRSPLEGAVCAAILDKVVGQVGEQVWEQVWDQVWGQVGRQVWDQVGTQVGTPARTQVWDQVGSQVKEQIKTQIGARVRAQVEARINQVKEQVKEQVRAQVGDQVGVQVWEQVGDQVWEQVWEQVWDQVGDQVETRVKDQVETALWGQHDGWLSFYDALRDVVDVSRLDGLMGLSHCGWCWCYDGTVILTERPVSLWLDAQGGLHNENGLAIEYGDGWGVAAWHGTRIPREWVEGALPSAQDALRWSNIEQRRAACELIGWQAILREVNATSVDKDADLEIGELLRADLPDSPGEQFLRVRCGTGREFVLPVPPNMRTAREANAWTYGLDADELAPEVRT